MKQDNFGQLIFSESDVCDLIMQGRNIKDFDNMLVDQTIDLERAAYHIETLPEFIKYIDVAPLDIDTFDQQLQSTWHMPEEYKQLDIAAHILGLCNSEAELQRCGHELLMYQERNLFELLKYLKYLVDVMVENNVIWGVGRGSSVASYILYKLGVHKIDSLYYDLSPEEFLR